MAAQFELYAAIAISIGSNASVSTRSTDPTMWNSGRSDC